MTDYDFKTLNDKEFEVLVTDVLSAFFNTRVERFKPGRDRGIDGRFFTSDGGNVIIQCKHWPKSSFSTLVSHLKKSEAAKVRQLQPKCYIFATSMELSPDNKAKIKDIFSPYIRQDNDVLGREDINDLLSISPEVEKRHYKLWINSTTVLSAVLDSIVHRGIYENSKALLDEIINEAKYYVNTDNLYKSQNKLESKNSIIITGSPGIGKTTLARQLCLDYINNDYQLCVIKNIEEADNVYDSDKKQIFYFDDFLGSNCLKVLQQHQDSDVVDFIRRVDNKKGSKKFILTSRTTILEQGRNLSSTFKYGKLEQKEYVVAINSLSRMEKARILYSHIWHGSLSDKQIEEIYESRRYLKIIDHHNYNPRIMSFITDSERMSQYTGGSYWDNVEYILDNSEVIWEPVIDNLREEQRHIIIATCLHGGTMTENQMRSVFSKLANHGLCTDYNERYERISRVLTRSLLNRTLTENGVTYELFNPSIADYIQESYFQNASYVGSILNCLQTPEALRNLYDYCISDEEADKTRCEIFSDVINQQINWVCGKGGSEVTDDYKLQLGLFALLPQVMNTNYAEKIKTNILNEKHDTCSDVNLILFITDCVENNLIERNDEKLLEFINELINCYECDTREFDLLIQLVKLTDNINFFLCLKEQYINYLKEIITDQLIEDGCDFIERQCYFDENGELAIEDDNLLQDSINEYIQDAALKINIDLNDDELATINNSVDVDEILYELNQQIFDLPNEFTSRSEDQYGNDNGAINDLFERD